MNRYLIVYGIHRLLMRPRVKTMDLTLTYIHCTCLYRQTSRMRVYGRRLSSASTYPSHTDYWCSTGALATSVTDTSRLLRPWTRLIIALYGRSTRNVKFRKVDFLKKRFSSIITLSIYLRRRSVLRRHVNLL